jgi:hypothetical protein
MARFFAYVRAEDLPNAQADTLATAIKADIEALVIRTYPGIGLSVDSYTELDEPAVVTVPEPPAPADPVIPPAGVDPTVPSEPEPAPPVAPVAVDPVNTPAQLFAADGITELTPVDSTLEADPNVVARDSAGNGYDATGNVIDPVVVVADPVEPTPIAEPIEAQTIGTGDVSDVSDVLATTTDVANAPGRTASGMPVYLVDGDANNVYDPALWPPADVHTPDGRPLFTYAGDIPGGAPTADGSAGIWHAYTGPVVVNG